MLTQKGCIVNPVVITTHGQLRAACAEYKNAVKTYGADSERAKAALARRQSLDNYWGTLKGVVKAGNRTAGFTLNDAIKRVTPYRDEVHSWFA